MTTTLRRDSNWIDRVLHLLALIVGSVGIVGCAAAILGAWVATARVNRATENVFGAIDDALVLVQQRVAQTQTHVQALKLTAADIEQSVKRWSVQEFGGRAVAKLELEQRADHLASGLEQVNHGLELAESSVQLVQQTLDAGRSLGVSIETERVNRLLEELASLHARLVQTADPVRRIRELSKQADDDRATEEEFDQIIQLAIRMAETLGLIDLAIQKCEDRLSELQAATRSAGSTAARWIQIASLGLIALLAWLAAGQGALCHLGWKGLSLRDSVSPSDSKS